MITGLSWTTYCDKDDTRVVNQATFYDRWGSEPGGVKVLLPDSWRSSRLDLRGERVVFKVFVFLSSSFGTYDRAG